ncbi:putative transmembrane GTPase FZO-like [Arachis hypogaea]|nr:putative transmembrane GTPase FZO-like [Arachis hypogaea]
MQRETLSNGLVVWVTSSSKYNVLIIVFLWYIEFLSTFGGVGVAGLSASLLTSVYLLALAICSAGGYVAISNFPRRRQSVIDKVKAKAEKLASELEEAMKKDFNEAMENLNNYVKILGKPYQDQAQNRLNMLLEIQEELSSIEKKKI